MPDTLLLELAGLIATVLFTGSYILLQMNKIEEESRIYNLMNITAAILAIVYQISYGAWMSVAGNLIWAVLGIFSLYRVVAASRKIKRRKRRQSQV